MCKCFAFSITCAISMACAIGQDTARSVDVLESLLESYAEAVRELRSSTPSTEERVKFRSEWRERLLVTARANPNSKYYKAALMKVLGLCNGLGDTEMANAIAAELEQLENDPVSQSRWRGEQAELARNTFLYTGDEASRKTAIEAFQDAIELTEGNEYEIGNETLVQKVVHQIMLAELLPAESREAAIALLNSASASLSSDDHLRRHAREIGFGIERIVTNMIERHGKNSDQDAVQAALATLSIEYPLRQEFWITVLHAAEVLYPDDRAKRLLVLRDWEDRTADVFSPMIVFHVARLEYGLEAYQDAQTHYEEIRTTDWEYFLKRDSVPLASERGGYCAEILINLTDCYLQSGELDRAIDAHIELRQLVPKDPRLPIIEARLAQAKESSVRSFSRPVETVRSRRAQVLAIGALAVAIALLVWRVSVWQREVK